MSDIDSPDYEPDDDYDPHADDTPAKEEPDCYACSDSGCPECGCIDPADPEHQHYVAREFVIERHCGRTPVPLDQLIPHATPEQRAEIQRLIDTAIVSTTVRWPTAAELDAYSDESPF